MTLLCYSLPWQQRIKQISSKISEGLWIRNFRILVIILLLRKDDQKFSLQEELQSIPKKRIKYCHTIFLREKMTRNVFRYSISFSEKLNLSDETIEEITEKCFAYVNYLIFTDDAPVSTDEEKQGRIPKWASDLIEKDRADSRDHDLKNKDFQLFISYLVQRAFNICLTGDNKKLVEAMEILSEMELPDSIYTQIPAKKKAKAEISTEVYAINSKEGYDELLEIYSEDFAAQNESDGKTIEITHSMRAKSGKIAELFISVGKKSDAVTFSVPFGHILIKENMVIAAVPTSFRGEILENLLNDLSNNAVRKLPQEIQFSPKTPPGARTVAGKKKQGTGKSSTMARNSTFQLKITLKGIRPPIWRRILIPGNTTLHDLHLMIQATMGWLNYHLYEFDVRGELYNDPDLGEDVSDIPARNSRKTRIHDIHVNAGDTFHYTYDFGDNWEIDVLLEKILPRDPAVKLPACTGGRRRGPAEDSGGIYGYSEMLSIIKDRNHEEREETLTWLGEDFDSEDFSIETCNKEIKNYKNYEDDFP